MGVRRSTYNYPGLIGGILKKENHTLDLLSIEHFPIYLRQEKYFTGHKSSKQI